MYQVGREKYNRASVHAFAIRCLDPRYLHHLLVTFIPLRWHAIATKEGLVLDTLMP